MMRCLFCLLMVFGVTLAAMAQDGAGAYSATVPVADTGDAARDAAIANALVQVLQRVAPGFSPSQGALSRASSLVRDFHYRRGGSDNGLQLQVDFDPGSIARLAGTTPGGAAAAGGPGPTAPAAGIGAAPGGAGNIWVDGLDDSHAFASLLATLRGDSALHDVTPAATQGNGVLLHVGFDQPLATVLAGLTGATGRLARDPQPHPGADASLRWVP